MTYACPVCEALVPDGEHLAHHLAVVAMTRGGDHRAWLDEELPGWTDDSPAELAEDAVERAESVDHDLVDDPRATSEDRAGAARGRPDVDAGRFGADLDAGEPGRAADAGADRRVHGPGERSSDAGGTVDGEAAAILEEARELTRQRRDDGAQTDDGAEENEAGGSEAVGSERGSSEAAAGEAADGEAASDETPDGDGTETGADDSETDSDE